MLRHTQLNQLVQSAKTYYFRLAASCCFYSYILFMFLLIILLDHFSIYHCLWLGTNRDYIYSIMLITLFWAPCSFVLALVFIDWGLNSNKQSSDRGRSYHLSVVTVPTISAQFPTRKTLSYKKNTPIVNKEIYLICIGIECSCK